MNERKKVTTSHIFGQDFSTTIVDTSSINFEEKHTFFGTLKSLDITIDTFEIQIESISGSLIVDRKNILNLKFSGALAIEGPVIKNLHITNYHNPYQILLNQSAIHDCTDLEATTAEINFTVRMKYGGVQKETFYTLQINLVKAKPDPVITFEPSEEDLYFKHEDVIIGQLVIENKCPYRFAEMAAIHLTVKYDELFKESHVTLGSVREIKESNPYMEHAAGLMTKSETLKSCLESQKEGKQILSLRKIVAQNKITIPVYMDLSQFSNPNENFRKETFLLAVKNRLDDSIDNQRHEVKIHRDNTTTKLHVTCNGHKLGNGTSTNCGHFKWIEFLNGRKRFNGTSTIIDLVIGNEAKVPGVSPAAAVVAKEVQVELVMIEGSIEDYNGENTLDPLLFDFNSPESDRPFIELKNGMNGEIGGTCKLQHNLITNIPDNVCKIGVKISFKYFEDRDGTVNREIGEYLPFEATAILELEKDPGSEWLCVDYGTSATVAIFGNGTENGTTLLNLDKRNEELLAEHHPQERFQKPRFEQGTPFLSSNIMLRDRDGVIGTNSFKESIIFLSPSEPLFNSSKYNLPYMKALVGYKNIPNPQKFDKFEYKSNRQEKSHTTFSADPIDVDTIFKATYRSLFQHYIRPTIDPEKIINKLVLTVPNTYTPHHINYLRKIAESEIPTLRKDYIWFVSESDAIAYYYINQWNKLNNNRKDNFTDREEHVLVYDMGAGTLDLTYLTILRQNHEVKVKMVSKIGLNKAGNYLDFILAKALVSTHPAFFPASLLEPTDDTNFRRLTGLLKHFIKTQLKPNLFTAPFLTFSEMNGETLEVGGVPVTFQDNKIDLKKIREHEIIEEFIIQCTNELFDNFVTLNNLKATNAPVDTLLMAGRSIQFGSIKERFQQCIRDWNGDNHCYPIEVQGNDLKTIVANGAMYYATLYGNSGSIITLENRNIYASYGIIYTDTKGFTRYQELINVHTKPIGKTTQKTAQNNGMTIYCYDTDLYSADEYSQGIYIDARNTTMAYLIQSYSPDPAADYDRKCFDYISIMSEFNPNTVVANPQECKNLHLRLQVNEQNQMIFSAGQITDEAATPLKIDIEKNETFRHSMWPFI